MDDCDPSALPPAGLRSAGVHRRGRREARGGARAAVAAPPACAEPSCPIIGLNTDIRHPFILKSSLSLPRACFRGAPVAEDQTYTAQPAEAAWTGRAQRPSSGLARAARSAALPSALRCRDIDGAWPRPQPAGWTAHAGGVQAAAAARRRGTGRDPLAPWSVTSAGHSRRASSIADEAYPPSTAPEASSFSSRHRHRRGGGSDGLRAAVPGTSAAASSSYRLPPPPPLPAPPSFAAGFATGLGYSGKLDCHRMVEGTAARPWVNPWRARDLTPPGEGAGAWGAQSGSGRTNDLPGASPRRRAEGRARIGGWGSGGWAAGTGAGALPGALGATRAAAALTPAAGPAADRDRPASPGGGPTSTDLRGPNAEARLRAAPWRDLRAPADLPASLRTDDLVGATPRPRRLLGAPAGGPGRIWGSMAPARGDSFGRPAVVAFAKREAAPGRDADAERPRWGPGGGADPASRPPHRSAAGGGAGGPEDPVARPALRMRAVGPSASFGDAPCVRALCKPYEVRHTGLLARGGGEGGWRPLRGGGGGVGRGRGR